MDTGASKGRTRSEINVTPLIDIVLVLLIVFIVMVPGLTKALGVIIPKEIEVTLPPIPPPLVVSLDQSGNLLLQSEQIPLSQLADRLTPVVQLQPMNYRKVFLKVDEDLPNQRAVEVLDQIRVASDRARRETIARTGF